MKKYEKKCLLCALFLVSGLICLFVGWIVWIKTGDSFTTGMALLLMGISFFIRPLAGEDEKHQTVADLKPRGITENKSHAHKAA